MSAPTNPRAFPCAIAVSASGDEYHGLDGMTLRDWFAGQALAGAMVGSFGSIMLSPQDVAAMAGEVYLIADAMLAERAKGGDA